MRPRQCMNVSAIRLQLRRFFRSWGQVDAEIKAARSADHYSEDRVTRVDKVEVGHCNMGCYEQTT